MLFLVTNLRLKILLPRFVNPLFSIVMTVFDGSLSQVSLYLHLHLCKNLSIKGINSDLCSKCHIFYHSSVEQNIPFNIHSEKVSVLNSFDRLFQAAYFFSVLSIELPIGLYLYQLDSTDQYLKCFQRQDVSSFIGTSVHLTNS